MPNMTGSHPAGARPVVPGMADSTGERNAATQRSAGQWHCAGRRMGRKSEAPRAAQRAEACAPPEATPGSEGDPPPIVPRALAFVSTNDIARRSLRFGGRSAFAGELAGCPVPSPTVKPLRFPRSPVSRRPLPPPRLPARLPRSPGSPPQPPRWFARRLATWIQDHPPTGSAFTS